jgi:hypothetical protein
MVVTKNLLSVQQESESYHRSDFSIMLTSCLDAQNFDQFQFIQPFFWENAFSEFFSKNPPSLKSLVKH